MSAAFELQQTDPVFIRRLFSVNVFVVLFVIFTFAVLPEPVTSSLGDGNLFYRNCLQECPVIHCNNGSHYRDQPQHLEYLGWDCAEECKYNCMWATVAIFEEKNVDIPQFHGKWPFIRVFGIQEPASAVASALNLFCHVRGDLFLQRVANNAPLFWYWHFFTLVAVHTWIWPIVFHSRDTRETELMDYFSAFSMIAFSFLSSLVRWRRRVFCMQVGVIAVPLMIFSFYHIYYLAFVHFDYGYNMTVNIVLGLLNAFFWLGWSWWNRNTLPYAWMCRLFILLACVAISLEVKDFPPILWTLDAHAAWHFSTAFITPIWYSFLIDDCLHLQVHPHQN